MEVQFDAKRDEMGYKIDDLVFRINCCRSKIRNMQKQILLLPAPDTLVDGVYSYQVQEELEAMIREENYQMALMISDLEALNQ